MYRYNHLKLKNRISKLDKNNSELDKDGFDKFNSEFMEAMDNNLNTSLALTTVYDVLKSEINDYTKLELIKKFDEVLSLDLLIQDEVVVSNHDEIMKLIEERNIAKKNKDFNRADNIRDELLNKGIRLIDTREGTTYEVVK